MAITFIMVHELNRSAARQVWLKINDRVVLSYGILPYDFSHREHSTSKRLQF